MHEAFNPALLAEDTVAGMSQLVRVGTVEAIDTWLLSARVAALRTRLQCHLATSDAPLAASASSLHRVQRCIYVPSLTQSNSGV